MIYNYPEAPERGSYELPFDTEGFIEWLRTQDLSEETIQRYVRALTAMIDVNILTRSYSEQICDYFNSEDDRCSLDEIISFFDRQLDHQLSDAKSDKNISPNRLKKYEVKKNEGYISAWHHYREFLLNRDKHTISDYGWQVLEEIATNHGIIEISATDVEDITKDLQELYHYSFWGRLDNVTALISKIRDALFLKNRASRVLLCITANEPDIKVVQDIIDVVIAKADGPITWGVYTSTIPCDNVMKIEVFEVI